MILMERIFLGCLVCIVFTLGCNNSDPVTSDSDNGYDMGNVDSSSIKEVRDFTSYRNKLVPIFERVFSGTMQNGNDEIPCTYTGEDFTMQFQLGSDMQCLDSDRNATDCKSATEASLGISGKIDLKTSGEISINGTVALYSGNSVVSADLHTGEEFFAESFGRSDFKSIDFDYQILQIEWSLSVKDSIWETCILKLDPAAE